MKVECMCCETDLGEKKGGEDGEVISGICDPCLELNFPNEAPKVKAYRRCKVCPERTLKCHVIACEELSKIFDSIDIELKGRGCEQGKVLWVHGVLHFGVSMFHVLDLSVGYLA